MTRIVPVVLLLNKREARKLELEPEDVADPEALGRWLRRLRRARRTTVEGLAAQLGVLSADVEDLERGDGRVAMWIITLYLEAFGFKLVLSDIQLAA